MTAAGGTSAPAPVRRTRPGNGRPTPTRRRPGRRVPPPGRRASARLGGWSERRTAARRGPAAFRWLTGASSAPALGVLVTLLCIAGLVMVGSASPVISLVTYGSPWTIFIRQALWMVVGVGALLILARIDYHKWRKLGVPLVAVTLVLLVAVLVPGVGVTAGGSARWIGFGLLRIQPSELMKLALVVFAADIVVRRTDRDAPAKQVIAPVIAVLVVSADPHHQAARHGHGHGAQLHRLRDPVHERRAVWPRSRRCWGSSSSSPRCSP